MQAAYGGFLLGLYTWPTFLFSKLKLVAKPGVLVEVLLSGPLSSFMGLILDLEFGMEQTD